MSLVSADFSSRKVSFMVLQNISILFCLLWWSLHSIWCGGGITQSLHLLQGFLKHPQQLPHLCVGVGEVFRVTVSILSGLVVCWS